MTDMPTLPPRQYLAAQASMMATSNSPASNHYSRPPYCPFCWEVGISTHIARPTDLKRHFKTFHRANNIWVCSGPGCGMMFEWESLIKSHQRTHHREQGTLIKREAPVKIELLPRLVFACGFSHCKYVLEAEHHDDSKDKTTTFFHHILNHFNEKIKLDWHYSVRIRNLMRQGGVDHHWALWKTQNKSEKLQWQPHNTFLLRKILETRHFPASTLADLVQLAGISRSRPYCFPNSPIPELAMAFSLPSVAEYAAGTGYPSIDLPTTVTGYHTSAIEYAKAPSAIKETGGVTLNDFMMTQIGQDNAYPPPSTAQVPSGQFFDVEPALSTEASQWYGGGSHYPTSEFTTHGPSWSGFTNVHAQWSLDEIPPPDLGLELQGAGDLPDASGNHDTDSVLDPRLRANIDE